MIKAVIVDDDAAFLDCFAEEVQETAVEHGLEFSLDTTTEPLKLLETQNEYDIYFFDIIMPEMTGIELAVRLRGRHNNKEFVFVSGHEQYIRSSMSAKPCGFIRKQHLEEDMREIFLCLDRILVLKGAEVILKNNTRDYSVQPRKIMYISSKGHYICLTYADGTRTLIRERMRDAAVQLESFGFLRVSNSCLVNLAYLEGANRDVVTLKNGYQAKITGKYRNNVATVLKNCLMECGI